MLLYVNADGVSGTVHRYHNLWPGVSVVYSAVWNSQKVAVKMTQEGGLTDALVAGALAFRHAISCAPLLS
jgi:hypothetical protein